MINQFKFSSLSLNKYALTMGTFLTKRFLIFFCLLRLVLILLLWLLGHNTTCCNASFCKKTISFFSGKQR